MDPHPLPELACETVLFHAIIYENHLNKDGSHKPQTFIRRREADLNGLSVNTSIRGCEQGLTRGIFGVRTVHIGTLRDLGFDVFMDSPDHGNIRFADGRLTPRRQDNEQGANDTAELLLGCTRPVPYWRQPNADDQFARELAEKREARRAAGQ
jgi:hypothetical protein